MSKKTQEYLSAADAASKKHKKYEDYVALKQKESAELREFADLMETPELTRNQRFTFRDYGDSAPDLDSVYNGYAADASPESEEPVLKAKYLGKTKIQEEVVKIKEDMAGIKTFLNGQALPATGGEAVVVQNNLTAAPAPPEPVGWQPPPAGFPTNNAVIGGSFNELTGDINSNSLGTYTGGLKKYKPAAPKRSSAQFLHPSVKLECEFSESLPEIDSETAKNPPDVEMLDRVRDGFKIVRTAERTMIYVVVKAKDATKNIVGQIRCSGGIAFGGYARDQANDTFLVECLDYIHLGTVPFGFRLEMPKCGSWDVDIPIPEKVLEKTLTPNQRKAMSNLREKYPEDAHEIFYLQLVLAN